MKKVFIVLAFAAFLLPANAAFGKFKFKARISCKKLTTKGTLNFIPGAPKGNYSVKLTSSAEELSKISIDGVTLTDEGVTKDFAIPKDESSGVSFNIGYDLETLQSMGTFEDMVIPFTLVGGDDLTVQTGFGSSTGELIVGDEGCSEDSSETPSDSGSDLGDIVEGTEQPSFTTINVNELVTADQDLMVNFTYKIPATAYAIFVGDLKEGEDITEKAKELAEKFSIKLDIKGLKKLAFKELRAAAKGKTGAEKEAAIEAAKNTGLNKLLKEIKLKLPPLPAKGAENREEIKKIRKAKKKKILEALTVELVEIKDSEDESQKCLSFKVTLPVKVCANEDGSKALVIAGQDINILNLEAGETFSADIPVKVVGEFQKFFGTETAARKRKGKKGPNGKTTMTLTLTNPVDE